MEKVYGKLREEDRPVLERVVKFFKEAGFGVGLHGTSLWNQHYKDVDLLVFSDAGKAGVMEFLAAVKKISQKHKGEVVNQKGNEEIGIDCDLNIGPVTLHISYVVLL